MFQVFCSQNNGSPFQDSKELPRTPGGEFYQLQLGSLRNSELVLELGINNTLEPAYESRLDIEFPASVSYIGTGPDSKLNLPVTGKTFELSVRLANEIFRVILFCFAVKNSTWLAVNLGNPFRGGEQATLQLRFSPKKDMNESIVVFHFHVATSSFQVWLLTLCYINFFCVSISPILPLK